MRILVLGGTAWLSGLVARAALVDGHDVTCLARGRSGQVPSGVPLVTADRDEPDAYGGVPGEWDVVVDVARQPGHVRRAVTSLVPRAGTYVLVSTGNVYADHAQPWQDESAPLLQPLPDDVLPSMELYGEAKVACEQHVLRAFGHDRALIARAGLLGGPGDVSGRSGYWPLRFRRPSNADGRVLVPDADEQPVQLLDARDLAAWLVRAAASGVSGVFNAVGETLTLGAHLGLAREVAGHDGALVPAGSEWLLAHDVEPWMGHRSLPLWLPDISWRGFTCRDGSRAVAAGLLRRPVRETLADTLAWELDRDPTSLDRDPTRERGAGLSDPDEAELLRELANT